jgi:hypothetical protein
MGGDLLAAHLPEFWRQGDEREGPTPGIEVSSS